MQTDEEKSSLNIFNIFEFECGSCFGCVGFWKFRYFKTHRYHVGTGLWGGGEGGQVTGAQPWGDKDVL